MQDNGHIMTQCHEIWIFLDGHQGGPQMSENVEKFIAINFPHLKNTLKLPKNTDFEHIYSTYSPPDRPPEIVS